MSMVPNVLAFSGLDEEGSGCLKGSPYSHFTHLALVLSPIIPSFWGRINVVSV